MASLRSGGNLGAGPFDPRVASWRPSPKMPARRAAAGAAGLGGLLYVAGGFIAGAPTELMIAYDPRHRTWTEIAAMNEHRGVPGAVAISRGVNRLIVVVGGAQVIKGNVTGFLDTTEVYDLDTQRWQTLRARLPERKAGLVCAAEIDGTVLAIAGGVLTDDGLAATRDVYALKVTGQDRPQTGVAAGAGVQRQLDALAPEGDPPIGSAGAPHLVLEVGSTGTDGL